MLQAAPILVRIVEQPVRETSIGDVVIGALGLTGILLLSAALLGALLGAILIGIKVVRAKYELDGASDSDALHIV